MLMIGVTAYGYELSLRVVAFRVWFCNFSICQIWTPVDEEDGHLTKIACFKLATE